MNVKKININQSEPTYYIASDIYDVSYHNSGTTFESLSELLSAENLSTLIPSAIRCGGMTIRFIQSSDNKYVQYRLMSDTWSNNPEDWAIADEGVYVENPEFVYVKTDNEGKILYGVKGDGNFYFGAGCPQQAKDYIEEKIADFPLDEYENIVVFLNGLYKGDKTLQKLLNEKVDKEDGKCLIDAEYASTKSTIDNIEFLEVTTDSQDKVLEGITQDGIKVFNIPIKTKSVNSNNIEAKKIKSDELVLSEEGINNLKRSFSDNVLIDKNIWWCGTSIPAGDYYKNTYPYMVGVNLNAKNVFNESVGASAARRQVGQGVPYNTFLRRMGNSISDQLEVCNDLWLINDINQTVSAGPNTLGITDAPSISTYNEAIEQRFALICTSYEVKLVARYLISDTTEHEQYLRGKLGNVYDALTYEQLHNLDYKGDVDLFVIDHGHNDNPSPVSDSDVDSRNMNTFIGAINTYISTIIQYKPHTRIIFLSDYDNYYKQNDVVGAQKQIAEHWHLPFLDLKELLPFSNDDKTIVRGYWTIGGVWKDKGFTYNPNAESIAAAFSIDGDAYFPFGTTIQEVATAIDPIQDENGVWWYSLSPRYIWIQDGIHPHSDKTKKCNTLYAQIVTNFIKNII